MKIIKCEYRPTGERKKTQDFPERSGGCFLSTAWISNTRQASDPEKEGDSRAEARLRERFTRVCGDVRWDWNEQWGGARRSALMATEGTWAKSIRRISHRKETEQGRRKQRSGIADGNRDLVQEKERKDLLPLIAWRKKCSPHRYFDKELQLETTIRRCLDTKKGMILFLWGPRNEPWGSCLKRTSPLRVRSWWNGRPPGLFSADDLGQSNCGEVVPPFSSALRCPHTILGLMKFYWLNTIVTWWVEGYNTSNQGVSEKRQRGVEWEMTPGIRPLKRNLTFDALPVAQKSELRPTKLKKPPENTPLLGSPGGTWLPHSAVQPQKGLLG